MRTLLRRSKLWKAAIKFLPKESFFMDNLLERYHPWIWRGTFCKYDKMVIKDIPALVYPDDYESELPFCDEILIFGYFLGFSPLVLEIYCFFLPCRTNLPYIFFCSFLIFFPINSTNSRIAGLILHSPLLSGMRVAFPGTQRTWCCDAFPSIEKIPRVQCPTLVIHGTDDDVNSKKQ